MSEETKKVETKSAEAKLKEMSKKAKEKGKANPPTPQTKPTTAFNQNWFIGGLGISAIIVIGYFIYKSRGAVNEAPSELQPFHPSFNHSNTNSKKKHKQKSKSPAHQKRPITRLT